MLLILTIKFVVTCYSCPRKPTHLWRFRLLLITLGGYGRKVGVWVGRERRENQAGMWGAEGKRLYPPTLGPSPVSMPLDVLVHLRIQPQSPEVSPAS